MKVFLGTNVWLSATVFSGLCEELLLQCSQADRLYTSPLIRLEAHEVLQRKFAQNPNACELFDAVWQEAKLIVDVADPADDNDARLVAAAAAAGMARFVTGDKRVLNWHSAKGPVGVMRIVAPRQAWQVLFGAVTGH